MVKSLTQDDVNFLKKELVPDIVKQTVSVVKKVVPEVVKTVIPQVNKLLLDQDKRVQKHLNAQTIRLIGQNVELEQKFEKFVTDSHSKIFDKIDPVLKEVKASQEARSLIEERVEALENIHQEGDHSLPTSN